MYKIEGNALPHLPTAVDFDTLEFETLEEVKAYVENSLLNGNFKAENNIYYLDDEKIQHIKIVKKTLLWKFHQFAKEQLNKVNPCKGDYDDPNDKRVLIHDAVERFHWHFKRRLSPNVSCFCCRELGYRFLKYGFLLLTIPMLPAIWTFIVGFSLVTLALMARVLL